MNYLFFRYLTQIRIDHYTNVNTNQRGFELLEYLAQEKCAWCNRGSLIRVIELECLQTAAEYHGRLNEAQLGTSAD